MATLNLSSDGPSINRSYQSIVDARLPSGQAGSSPTYGQWALYSVTAPLVNAFQPDAGKESVLKLQSTGEGELIDLIDEFSDGRIQFAYVKVKDPNTALPKSVLIAWCGEGVPERTKGYFGSHLTAVSNLLHGYHVQVTARTDRDLTPESIIRKVADSSGSRYGGDTAPAMASGGPPLPAASKPAFTPTQIGGGSKGFNALGSRPLRANAPPPADVDDDGWGKDAPQVTRTQLEKVAPAYRPTKVNINELTSSKSEPSRFNIQRDEPANDADVVRGGYQPIGKVDIAAIRRQAQDSGNMTDDRPAPVKGSYEPIGKVDIAAIRARAQPLGDTSSPPPTFSPAETGGAFSEQGSKSLADRSAAFKQSDRMTSLPKPKVANKFGSGGSSFTGTKAPTPGTFGGPVIAAPVIGLANKNFGNEGGKTPAQLWAEKKARERGNSGAAELPKPASPMATQASGGGDWNNGYSGKKWNSVQTTRTGTSAASGIDQQRTGENDAREDAPSPAGNVSAIRDRFKNAAPMGAASLPSKAGFEENEQDAPPPPPMASRPNAGGPRGVPMPGFARPSAPPAEEEEEEYPEEEPARMPTPPAQPPRSPTPPTPPAISGSPIRVAMPVGRGAARDLEPAEQFSPPPMPTQSISRIVPAPRELEEEPQVSQHDPARAAGAAAATTAFGAGSASATPKGPTGGKRAIAQFDYEKAEDNELELRDGEQVTNIEMVDDDWWFGENERGEKGLFPSNYVELVEAQAEEEEDEVAAPAPPPAPAARAAAASRAPTATAQFDYEAVEDNELSFPDGATITSLEFPDEDWWLGEYNGKKGLFPANYVQLDE